VTTVNVFSGQADNLQPGRQPEAHCHLIAAVIALVYDFSAFNQIKILSLSGSNSIPR